MENEEFRPILGFEDLYAVSDRGRVRTAAGSDLKSSLDKDGYCFITLRRDGKSYGRRIHRMVLEAFVGPCPPGMIGCHGIEGRQTNTVSNLRWDTYSENMKDKARHGTQPFGEKTSQHKLTEAQVLAIRSAPKGKATALGREFGVTKASVQAIRIGRNWPKAGGEIKSVTDGRGENHPNSRLTAEQIASIRADTRLQRVIAAEYGIHQVTVSKIKRGALWAHAA